MKNDSGLSTEYEQKEFQKLFDKLKDKNKKL